jgi:hypothetical protein
MIDFLTALTAVFVVLTCCILFAAVVVIAGEMTIRRAKIDEVHRIRHRLASRRRRQKFHAGRIAWHRRAV